MKHLEGIILDWAGTTVDFGCFAPVEAFIRVFQDAGITVTMDEARAPMGLLKIDHIRAMLAMPRIRDAWEAKYQRPSQEDDVKTLFANFEPLLMRSLADYTTPIPGVLDAVNVIRGMGLKIGSTTGYTDNMMDCVVMEAKKRGYAPDCWFTPDATGQLGRPYPYMIHRNMEYLKITSPKRLVKIGDTVSDIQEGLNAGAWTVGIALGSSVLGLTEAESATMNSTEQQDLINAAKKTFLQSGAHFALDSIDRLPDLLIHIDQLMENGERP